MKKLLLGIYAIALLSTMITTIVQSREISSLESRASVLESRASVLESRVRVIESHQSRTDTLLVHSLQLTNELYYHSHATH